MKRFSIFCLPAVVMAGALLLASCGKDNSTPAPAPTPEPAVPVDLSAKGTANCYIVSAPGTYSFKTVQGNSNDAVVAAKAEVLWESFGTETKPEVGDIIKSVSYADSRITFTTPSTLKNGNALIAAKDADGNILWSWHIWVCEGYDPVAQGQVYNSDAGTMMDRNLGATSAEPGKVQTLGLMYQWGRKDPFLGSSSISSPTKALSTITWPGAVLSDADKGTVDYAIQNPTTFICGVDASTNDWVFAARNANLWKAEKTKYDPCPYGWKVPSGGASGVWSKSIGSSNFFKDYPFDSANRGMNFSSKLGSALIIWYPAAACLKYNDGSFGEVGSSGSWWSCSYYYGSANLFGIERADGYVYPSGSGYLAYGYSVRCLQE